jgi:3-oxoacyl-[acyl-carrier protein] reductase
MTPAGASSSPRPVALVTGGTRGIGLGIARALAREGWSLALGGVRDASEVASLCADLASAGGLVTYTAADISSADDRARLLADVLARHGRLDALVNNAGRAPRVRADLLEASEASFDELIQTNLRGPYFLTQAVARHWSDAPADPAARGRAIVFITSVSSDMASPNRGDYCVSKAGLAMAARVFAVRLAPLGIPVYDIRPGIIDTDMTARVREVYDRRIADGLVPAGRWGTPDDVGRAVAAALRGDLAFSTGAVIHVDGGLSVPRL